MVVQVAQLTARAISFGNWFPVNFPRNAITPKMHFILYHMPEYAHEYAKALGSAGSTNEQVIESFHASWNVYARNYACIEDVQLRFTSAARGQWARQHMQGGVRNIVSKETIKKREIIKFRKQLSTRDRLSMHNVHSVGCRGSGFINKV